MENVPIGGYLRLRTRTSEHAESVSVVLALPLTSREFKDREAFNFIQLREGKATLIWDPCIGVSNLSRLPPSFLAF